MDDRAFYEVVNAELSALGDILENEAALAWLDCTSTPETSPRA